jgi:predicted DNA-binding transcriptional regulator YafY
MADSTTTSRILTLLNLLQTHRHWAGRELAARLGVTERTLRRDVERLRDLGYEVESAPGATGGYRLGAGATLPPLLLSDDEAVTMAIGLRVAATQGLVDGVETTMTALAKLQQVLPSGLRSRVEALGSHVSLGTPERPTVSPDLIGQLAMACRDRERIRFRYRAADGAESQRSVEPEAIVPRQGHWFLVAWDRDRGDWRTFRVDRLSDLFATRVHFEARNLLAADAAEYVEVSLSQLRAGVEVEAVLEMTPEAMRDHFGPWAEGSYPEEGPQGVVTVWPVGGQSARDVVFALVWIPEGVAYTLRGDEAVIAGVHEMARRMLGRAA